MKNLAFFVLFGFCILLFYSCGDDNANTGVNVDIPEFYLDVPEGSGIPTSDSSSGVKFSIDKKFWAMLQPVPNAFAQEISCDDELASWNEATRLSDPAVSPIDYVIYFYAQSRFYGCNAVEQAQYGEITPSTQTDENDETVSVLTAQHTDSDDNVSFVSWTDDYAVKGKGKLVNNYLEVQAGEEPTRTRVDLLIENSLKTVESLLKIEYTDDPPADEWLRADFKEIATEGDVIEHHVTGRYSSRNERGKEGTVVVIRASVKENIGTSVFKRECKGTVNAKCDSATEEPSFYNSDGDEVVDATAAETLGLLTDGTEITIQNDFFYSGAGDDNDYFDPAFNIND